MKVYTLEYAGYAGYDGGLIGVFRSLDAVKRWMEKEHPQAGWLPEDPAYPGQWLAQEGHGEFVVTETDLRE